VRRASIAWFQGNSPILFSANQRSKSTGIRLAALPIKRSPIEEQHPTQLIGNAESGKDAPLLNCTSRRKKKITMNRLLSQIVTLKSKWAVRHLHPGFLENALGFVQFGFNLAGIIISKGIEAKIDTNTTSGAHELAKEEQNDIILWVMGAIGAVVLMVGAVLLIDYARLKKKK
jgi:hypothetical protein